MGDPNELVRKTLESRLVEKVYDDGLSPSVREASKIPVDLVKTARLLLAPIQILGALQDRFEKVVAKIAGRVEPGKLVEGEPSIVGPVLENLKYRTDDDILTEGFINLLCRAIDSDRQDEAHPAFIKILENISPDEAMLLYLIAKKDLQIVDTMDLDRANNQFFNRKIEKSDVPSTELRYPKHFDVYSTHLEALGLISWPVYKQTPIMVAGTQAGVRRNSKIELTPLGKLFVSACVPDEEPVNEALRKQREKNVKGRSD